MIQQALHSLARIPQVLSTGRGWVTFASLSVLDYIAGHSFVVFLVVAATLIDAVWGIAVSLKKGEFTKSELARQTIKVEHKVPSTWNPFYTKLLGRLHLDVVYPSTSEYMANGQNYFVLPPSLHYSAAGIPFTQQIMHLECKHVIWSSQQGTCDYQGYGYVWLGEGHEPSDSYDEIDGLDSWN